MRLALVVVMAFSSLAFGQTRNQPRVGAATSQSLTGTLPSGTPLPVGGACPSCNPPNYGGQSTTVAGAVSLLGCTWYQVLVCVAAGGTINAVGIEQVSYWPISMPASVGITTWPRNKSLDENHALMAAGQQCHIFPAHPATGIGWIQVTPSAVTVAGGATTVTTAIEVGGCAS